MKLVVSQEEKTLAKINSEIASLKEYCSVHLYDSLNTDLTTNIKNLVQEIQYISA